MVTCSQVARDGIGIALVAALLGKVATANVTCGHLSVENARGVMQQAGWFTDRPGRLGCPMPVRPGCWAG